MKMGPPGSAMNCSHAELTPASSAHVSTFMASNDQLCRLVLFTLTAGCPARMNHFEARCSHAGSALLSTTDQQMTNVHPYKDSCDCGRLYTAIAMLTPTASFEMQSIRAASKPIPAVSPALHMQLTANEVLKCNIYVVACPGRFHCDGELKVVL